MSRRTLPTQHPQLTVSDLGLHCVTVALLLLALTFVSAPCAAQATPATPAGNPILPGDHPDPTIIRTGSTYWTTSTAGDWAPVFGLYRSEDLHHWTPAGAVFPHVPEWASGDFWAPEMVADGNQVLVFYVARRKRQGTLCVAIAVAPAPEGPYTDHGPLLCQSDGSIDPAFARDEHGQPFLIWKEDGNSQGRPTPIWAQPLTPDLLHLSGSKTQLLVNDPATWEGAVIEAPYIMRHAGRFYLFYAGNACCGVDCHYAEGVARADHLLGNWVKDPANPIIAPNRVWKCPGHGTAVQTPNGEDFFLYHSYPANGSVYMGRESVLDRITWKSDGWPEINRGHGPAGEADPKAQSAIVFEDAFTGGVLNPEWKWPIGHEPNARLHDGMLTLSAPAAGGKVLLARSPLAAAYTASVSLLPIGSAAAGLGIIGNADNAIALVLKGSHLELLRSGKDGQQVVWQSADLPRQAVWLRVHVNSSPSATFEFSSDQHTWTPAGPALSLGGLQPWDQGLRIGLLAIGSAGAQGTFAKFRLVGSAN